MMSKGNYENLLVKYSKFLLLFDMDPRDMLRPEMVKWAVSLK